MTKRVNKGPQSREISGIFFPLLSRYVTSGTIGATKIVEDKTQRLHVIIFFPVNNKKNGVHVSKDNVHLS